MVSLGDWVEAGEPMAKLVSVEIGQAVSDYYKSVAECELAKVNYERYQRLISQNIGARKDLIAAEAEFKIAEANLNACEKALHALGFTEEDVLTIKETHTINAELLIRAPISGSVVERDVTVGEQAGEDSTLFTVMDLRRLYVDAQIYEQDIGRVSLGRRTETTVNAVPGRRLEGTVVYIGQKIDEATRTLALRTEIENPGGALKAGMFARVKIFAGNDGPILCIPARAILEEKGKSFVFVPDGDAYRLVPVTVGVGDGLWIEIREGLNEGDQVVTDGNYGLYSMLKQSSGRTLTH
jgi:cobalt-zinc-cadmium efflux system membrane fusion protein